MSQLQTLSTERKAPISWKERWRYEAPAVFYVLAVFIGGSIPIAPHIGVPVLSVDKVQHLLAFAAMQVLVQRALVHARVFRADRNNLLAAALGCIVLGGFLELWQAALPYRSAEWGDFLADALGVLMGTVLSVLFGWHVGAKPQPA